MFTIMSADKKRVAVIGANDYICVYNCCIYIHDKDFGFYGTDERAKQILADICSALSTCSGNGSYQMPPETTL